MEELVAILALARIAGIPYQKKREIVEGPESVSSLFKGCRKIHDRSLRARIASFDEFSTIDAELKNLGKLKADVVTLKDAAYPEQLRQIPEPPLVLFRRGRIPVPNECLSIVGSRKATFEGMNLSERVAETLSSLGITIVSGFARGIDSSAHRGALKGRGKTIAVFGCGLDICYPAENNHLYGQIGNDGLMLTEYPLGTRPFPQHFPARNRIIAGLSRGVLVIEATSKSGSLITARLALDYGREVMAAPGRIFDEEYRGANSLIKQGAKLIENMEDIIFTCFPGLELKKEEGLALEKDEEYIYGLIGINKMHVDELAEKGSLSVKDVLALLTRLEMKDLVRALPGGFYLRKV
jgi:DNA processing protein